MLRSLLQTAMISVSLQVFIAISLILGDGLYNLIKIISLTVKEICNKSTTNSNLPLIKEATGGYFTLELFKLILCYFLLDFFHLFLLHKPSN